MTSTTERTTKEEAANTTPTPRVYLACLASYNAGILHGVWAEAMDEDALREAVATMLAESPTAGAEEFAIHDHEGFGSWGPDEYEGLAEIAAKGPFIAEHGQLGAEVLAHFSGRLDEAEAAFDGYAGEWPDLGHFAEDLTEQSGVTIPDSVRLYVDYDAMGRDLELGGDVFTVRTSFDAVHVFWTAR
ncbi:antirestriction protein ArdA [Parvularcula oceani]|uniref:antirestriction protein ArdA n=1 Tax=Parvularcula oceani TaxID=1247963 RepID=UPI000690D40C|nr:antirestriction protein ArdA [Parvularcula oceani]